MLHLAAATYYCLKIFIHELLHFAQVSYFAFDSWDEAHRFWKSITDKQVCGRAQVREAERFTSYPWEVKVWAMSVATLEKLIERDTKRYCHKAERKRQPKALPLPQIKRDWSLSDSHSALAIEAV